MNKFMDLMNKMEPFFKKVSQNKYLKAIMNGFMSMMYLILFSSIFMIINAVPSTWGFYWPPEVSAVLMKAYNLSMGLLGLFMAGAIAKALADEMNRDLSEKNRINIISVFVASMISFMILTIEYVEGGINVQHFGASGLFAAILVAFVTVNIYKFCNIKNITIRMHEAVPPNISSAFGEVIAFSLSIIFFIIVDVLIRYYTGANIATALMSILSPLFDVGDSYIGFMVIAASVSILTYMGLHGSSIVLPILSAVMIVNLADNQAMLQAGQVPTSAFTSGMTGAMLMGGSGATLMVTFMFAFMAKSKTNKAIGKAAIVPGNFMINEPILFGAPILLNPYFLVPYIVAPMANVVIYKFFVDTIGMGGAIASLGFGFPNLIGYPGSHGFSVLSFVSLGAILLADFVIYYPFFKAYDKTRVTEELNRIEEDEEVVVIDYDSYKESNANTNVLVLCIMGGTSGLLANAVNKGAKELDLSINAKANQVSGVNFDELGDLDLVVLAPQAKSEYELVKSETDKRGIKLVTTDGPQYITLGQNPNLAVDFILESLV